VVNVIGVDRYAAEIKHATNFLRCPLMSAITSLNTKQKHISVACVKLSSKKLIFKTIGVPRNHHPPPQLSVTSHSRIFYFNHLFFTAVIHVGNCAIPCRTSHCVTVTDALRCLLRTCLFVRSQQLLCDFFSDRGNAYNFVADTTRDTTRQSTDTGP
jgi:hypothetical protein